MVSNCDEFYYVVLGDGCWAIANDHSIALDDFYSWNPAIGTDCAGLQPDVYVCVGLGSSSTASATKTTSSFTTTVGAGVTTPTPTQTGMVSTCDKFYYVISDDGCWAIANDNGIALDDFYSWNPAVGSDCSGLQSDVYVCVGVSGSSATTATATATTTPIKTTAATTTTAGVTTPTPTQTGMVSGCKTFYYVVSGDGCWGIANDHDIELADFYSWNSAIGTDCANLWPETFVCVGV
jgi:hypothetical protein